MSFGSLLNIPVRQYVNLLEPHLHISIFSKKKVTHEMRTLMDISIKNSEQALDFALVREQRSLDLTPDFVLAGPGITTVEEECPYSPITAPTPDITCKTHPDILFPSLVLACFEPFVSDLQAHHYAQLDTLVNRIQTSFKKGRPLNWIRITGHGAKWPPSSKNIRILISQERAAVVENELKKRLIAAAIDIRQIKFSKRGVGCMQPRVPNNSQVNRRLNLRVVVELKQRPTKPVKPPKSPKSPKAPKKSSLKPGSKLKVPRFFCKSSIWGNVSKYWKKAVRRVAKANDRLRFLDGKPENQRQSLWDQKNSLERKWFGQYSSGRFQKVRQGMLKIESRLRDNRLKIRCRFIFPNLLGGAIIPYGIILYKGWQELSSGDIDKVETIIHEAAHLVRVGRVGEIAGYGRALKLAQNFPRRAVRRADNFGYYAMELP